MNTNSTFQSVGESTYPAFAVEHQQQIANAMCSLFLINGGTLHAHNRGTEEIKDSLNALYRELVHQHEQAKTGDEEGWWSSDDINHSLGAQAAFVTRLCKFFDVIGALPVVIDAVKVDPYQHISQGDGHSLGYRPIEFAPRVPKYGLLAGKETEVVAEEAQAMAIEAEAAQAERAAADARRKALDRIEAAQKRFDKARGVSCSEEHTALLMEKMADEAEQRAAEPPKLKVVDDKSTKGKKTSKKASSRTSAKKAA